MPELMVRFARGDDDPEDCWMSVEARGRGKQDWIDLLRNVPSELPSVATAEWVMSFTHAVFENGADVTVATLNSEDRTTRDNTVLVLAWYALWGHKATPAWVRDKARYHDTLITYSINAADKVVVDIGPLVRNIQGEEGAHSNRPLGRIRE